MQLQPNQPPLVRCQGELRRQRSTVLVAEDGGQAVGWAVGWQVPDELHLMNVSGQLAILC